MEKNAFCDDMRNTFRFICPEKNDDEINRMIDSSYEKFEEVVQEV